MRPDPLSLRLQMLQSRKSRWYFKVIVLQTTHVIKTYSTNFPGARAYLVQIFRQPLLTVWSRYGWRRPPSGGANAAEGRHKAAATLINSSPAASSRVHPACLASYVPAPFSSSCTELHPSPGLVFFADDVLHWSRRGGLVLDADARALAVDDGLGVAVVAQHGGHVGVVALALLHLLRSLEEVEALRLGLALPLGPLLLLLPPCQGRLLPLLHPVLLLLHLVLVLLQASL